ncbi:unnamed protein product [Ilex paraguariensis]|uniref:AB hydrolase-1 domain-containing protein n=1 Tax=Ilex paraguariensis TaxID=185542 RepID=A0ABC8SBE6_9AQUA
MARCFNLTASGNWCLAFVFRSSGLRSTVTDLGDGTIMHCWVPKTRKPTKPNLVLIHGFGANAMWQWSETIRVLISHFNIYVPDLIFFGDSFTTRPERSESFQAQCVMRVMDVNSVDKMTVVGLSYGGFVAYSMAAQFEERIERVVICCAGVCLEEKDLTEGLFPVGEVEAAADILVPQTAEKMRELMRFTFVKPPKRLPTFFLNDFIQEMCTQYVEEKKELIRAIPKDRKLSDLTKITQPTLIVWGDQDKIFPLELGHRLKRHLGEKAQLVIIKNTGHAFIYEKPRLCHKHLKSFLIVSAAPPPPTSPLPNLQNGK